MSLYHKRVFLRQKNSTLSQLMNPIDINVPNITQSIRSAVNSSSSQSLSNISSSNKLYYPNIDITHQPFSTVNRSKLIIKILSILETIVSNQLYIILMSILTIWTIFSVDIDKGFFNVDASTYFSTVYTVAIFLFVLQSIMLSLTKQQYFLGFYFWVDCLSTCSMFLQLIWIENLMSGSTSVTVALSFAKLTKASRLSRIGARASKMMKLIRSIKWVKLVGLQQQMDSKKDKNKNKQIDEVNKDKQQYEYKDDETKMAIIMMNTHNQKQQNQGNNSNSDPNNSSQNSGNCNQQPVNHNRYEDIVNSNVIEKFQQQSSLSSHERQQPLSQSQSQSQSMQNDNQYGMHVRQSQSNPLMTFKPIIQKKQLTHLVPFENLHHHHEIQQHQQQQQEMVNKGTMQEDLSIQAEEQEQFQNLDDNHDSFLEGNQQIQPIQSNKHQQQQNYSKLTISAHHHINPSIHTNNFAIPDIDQPSQTLVESLQQISQEGKNNIQDIMKIFFTQNMSHFIQKGKEIHSSNGKQTHHYFLRPKISLQEDIKFLQNQKGIIQIKENQDKARTKNKSKKAKKTKKPKQSQAQIQLQQLKITESNKVKEQEIKVITNKNNNTLTQQTKTVNTPKLQQKLNNSNEKYVKHQQVDNSGRSMNLKNKQSMSQSTKRRQLKQKFHRSHHTNTTTIEVPFANIVKKMQRQIHLEPLERRNVDPVKQAEIQKKYDELREREIMEKPKKVLNAENLKVGEVLKEQIQKNIVVMVMGLVIVLPILTADIWFNADPLVSQGAHLFVKSIWQLPTPQSQTQLLQSFIQTGLLMNTPLQYFQIPINSTCCQFPLQFPSYSNNSILDYSQLRLSQQMVVVDGNITIIFSRKYSTQMNSYLNLVRSLFITTLLVFCSIIFMRDIENHAITPLQKMSSLINKISINPFQVLKQINQQKSYIIRETQSWSSHSRIIVNNVRKGSQQQELQTNILSNVIIKITSLLTVGAGEIGAEMISRNIQTMGREMDDDVSRDRAPNSLGQYLLGVYVYIQMRGFELMCDIFGDQIFRYMNRVCEVVHLCCIQMGGIPIEYDGRGFLLLFKTDSIVQRVILAESKQLSTMRRMINNSKRSGDERVNSSSVNGADNNNRSSSRKRTSVNSKHQTKVPVTNLYGNYQNIRDTIIQSSHSNQFSQLAHDQQQQQQQKSIYSQQNEQNILCNLALLGISAMTRIMLQVNQLQQSRMLYQCILQRFPSSSNHNNTTTNRNSVTTTNKHHNNTSGEQNGGNSKFVHATNNNHHNDQPSDMFPQNYQPHLINASVHVGECIYGSLGSDYKLDCKCIGYDIAYVRHLCHMIVQQSYGVSNIISEDVYSLLSQAQYLTQRLKIRQIDHVNIKQLRHKDYKKNPDLHFIPADKLVAVKAQKQTVTKFYTCDFYAKLETFNSNESNFGHSVVDFKLNKSQYTLNQRSQRSSVYNDRSPSTKNLHTNTLNTKPTIPGNLNSFRTVDDISQNCLIAYHQREKWLMFSQRDNPILLLAKLEAEYPQLKQSKMIYQQEFYTMWGEALDAFYSQELTEAMNEFKNLHMYNQPFYDGPSRFFIHRIEKLTGINDYNSFNNNNFEFYISQSEHTLNQNGTQFSLAEPMFGVRDVIWKL